MSNFSGFIKEALNLDYGFDDSFVAPEDLIIVNQRAGGIIKESDNDDNLLNSEKNSPGTKTYRQKYYELLEEYQEAEYKQKYKDLKCQIAEGNVIKPPNISFKAIIISSLIFIIIILWFNVVGDVYSYFYDGKTDPFRSLLFAIVATLILVGFCIAVYIW